MATEAISLHVTVTCVMQNSLDLCWLNADSQPFC